MSRHYDTIDFIGVGAARCGTSWIYKCLKEHPQICVSKEKEIHFFNEYWGFHKPNEDWRYKKGINWYLNQFSHCKEGQIKGEMDTRYLYEKKALELIKKNFPQIKIIITLRNPVDRAYSNFLRHIQRHFEYYKKVKNFEDAIKTTPEFIYEGFYYEHVKNCLKIFSPDNILILFYHDLVKDPKKFIKKLYSFLGVNPNYPPLLCRIE